MPPERIFVITNAEQREAVLESCPTLLPGGHREPEGRDTAAAVGLAALLVEKEGENAAFALLPADHVIEDAKAFGPPSRRLLLRRRLRAFSLP